MDGASQNRTRALKLTARSMKLMLPLASPAQAPRMNLSKKGCIVFSSTWLFSWANWRLIRLIFPGMLKPDFGLFVAARALDGASEINSSGICSRGRRLKTVVSAGQGKSGRGLRALQNLAEIQSAFNCAPFQSHDQHRVPIAKESVFLLNGFG